MDQTPAQELALRIATPEDLPQMIDIIEAGRALLAADGINQWQHGEGPSAEVLAADVAAGYGRVFAAEGGTVAATAALIGGRDASYDVVEGGAWEEREGAGSGYATIHRVAVSPAFRGRHVARRFYAALIDEARERGFSEIRVDTHEQNARMRHVIEGAGFTYVGTIYVDGDRDQPRRAYQQFL